MSNDALDLAFARHVRQIGLVTPEQVTSALQSQAKSHQSGTPISFAEALVQLGLLTPAQRETLEKKVKDQQAGVQQLGPYKLVRKLGEGGMGAVYLAVDPASGRNVAVKVLPRQLGANPEFVKRFGREAEAAKNLKHPNIIGATTAGEDLGYHYYVMEFCEGETLDAALKRERVFPPGRAVEITLQAARGLQFAHQQGILHRDIKPSNIMLTKDGTAKILDLGLSKHIDDSAMSFKTVTGAVLGTPHYISPEQAQGEKHIDGRTDIYSLGATLYHLLTGQTPFDGATALEILSKHVNTQLPNPQDLREDLPDATVQVLERMMAKEPADRYPDCGALITDLEELVAGRTPKTQILEAARTTIAPSLRRSQIRKRPPTIRRVARSRNNKTPLIAAGVVAAAVVVILAVMLSGNSDPAPVPLAPVKPLPLPKEAATPKLPAEPVPWERSVANLPPEARVKAVVARLKDLNPGYDGMERHETGHGGLSRLELSHPSLKDLSPLRALPELGTLDLSGTAVSDLSPLRDTKVVSLALAGTAVVDLRPLRAAKELKYLSLRSTPVRDLSPLEGLELWQLNLRRTGITDLSALKRVRLKELICDFDEARDTEIVKSIPTLEKINELPLAEFWGRDKPAPPPPPPGPEDKFRAVLAKMKLANPGFDGREDHELQDGAVVSLEISGIGVVDLTPLAEFTGLRRLDVSGYWDTGEKREYRSVLKDLGGLRGMSLEVLRIHHTAVSDLDPLKGLKLEELDASSCSVRSIAALHGMPLKKLKISFNPLRDLSPLEGLPLAELTLDHIDATDFAPLRNLPLRDLSIDLDPQKGRALVSSIKTLERINGIPVAEYLKAGASAKPPPPAPAPVLPPEPAPWKKAIDLIALIDPQRDAVRGTWRKENGRLISDYGENCVLRIPYEPPLEYDFRIVFTRVGGRCSTAQFLQRDGRAFFWEMAGWGGIVSGFSLVGNKGSKENATRSDFVPRDGVKYTCVIQVRRDRVVALLDEKKISEWLPSMGEITTDTNWCVDVPNLIGLGNCETLTTFENVQVRDVTGRGRIRTQLTTLPDAAFLRTVAATGGAQEQLRRVFDKLRELNPGFDSDLAKPVIENDRVVELSLPTGRVMDVWPLRGFPYLKKLDLGDDRSVLSDISCLRGLKLVELNLSNTRVVDLTPLLGMPLTRLQLSGTAVKDLAPLRGMKLASLSIGDSAVTDLAPLKDMRSLKTINDQPAAEFMKNQKEGWTALFDGRSLDCLRTPKGWKFEKGAIVNEPDDGNSAQTKFEFENGDLRIRFEAKGLDSCTFRVRQSENGACSVFFDGVAARALDGKPHELILSCKGPQVTAALDGKALTFSEIKPVRSGCLQFNGTTGTLRVTSIEYRSQ
jgi:serine/threonine protein kinase